MKKVFLHFWKFYLPSDMNIWQFKIPANSFEIRIRLDGRERRIFNTVDVFSPFIT